MIHSQLHRFVQHGVRAALPDEQSDRQLLVTDVFPDEEVDGCAFGFVRF